MSRCQSVAIGVTCRDWPGYLPCWDGPVSVRREEGRGWIDGWRACEGGGVTVPRRDGEWGALGEDLSHH